MSTHTPRPLTRAESFVDVTLERALLAAIARGGADVWWRAAHDLPAAAFVYERATFEALTEAVKNESAPLPRVPDEWQAADDPEAAAASLRGNLSLRICANGVDWAAGALDEAAAKGTPAAQVLEQIQETIVEARDAEYATRNILGVWAPELVDAAVADIADRVARRQETGAEVLGIPTGFRGLDRAIGGLEAGIYICAGAPGGGKTTFAFQIAEQVAAHLPVVFVTFEMSPDSLVKRALCRQAGVRLDHLQNGRVDLHAIQEAAPKVAASLAKVRIIAGSPHTTPASILAAAMHARHRYGSEKCMIAVDYLQKMAQAISPVRNPGDVRHDIARLTRDLRDVGLRLDSPVLAISSQNRAEGRYGAGSGTPSLASLKESGSLEYDADCILFLSQDKEGEELPMEAGMTKVLVTIMKNRTGPAGEGGAIPMIFNGAVGRFTDISGNTPPPTRGTRRQITRDEDEDADLPI